MRMLTLFRYIFQQLQKRPNIQIKNRQRGRQTVPFDNIVPFVFYLFNSSKNSLFKSCGFAFPLVSFIAWPTKYPKALSFPAL